MSTSLETTSKFCINYARADVESGVPELIMEKYRVKPVFKEYSVSKLL